MNTFIIQAARHFLELEEAGKQESNFFEPDQLDALRDELAVLSTSPTHNGERADRGRIVVSIFNYDDDNETMAADVIADILHWVQYSSGEKIAGSAFLKAARYYAEER